MDYSTVLADVSQKLTEQLELLAVIQQYEIWLLFGIGVLCGLVVIRLIRW